MEVWSGDVKLDDGVLQDLRLFFPDSGKQTTSFTPDLSLSFTSLVALHDVPLPCLAGPVLDVFTTSQATEDWLAKYLLDGTYEYESDEDDGRAEHCKRASWWAQGAEQSNVGVLLQVYGHASTTRARIDVKEILLYASISDTPREARESILTPPGSSSPSRHSEVHMLENHGPRTAHIHARLLYSGFPWSRDGAAQLPVSDTIPEDEAQFLTPPREAPHAISHIPPEAAKRRKVDLLFEEAARENKRSRKRGGENVAHVMAKGERPSPVLFPHGLREPIRPVSQDGSAGDPHVSADAPTLKRTAHLSRSKSISSLRDLEESRPSSRHSNPAISDVQKRSLLQRVSSKNDQDGAPSPTTEVMSVIEAQNRSALTRVVMAGLRLYGFQTKKKPLASAQDQLLTAADPDEEYKILYHQTFKAAAFAFRKHVAVQLISQTMLREVVDKLLVMFCVNSVKQPLASESFDSSVPKGDEAGMDFDFPGDCREEAKNLDNGLLSRKSGSQG